MKKDYELRVSILKDTRAGKMLYFKSSKEAHRVADACMMIYMGTALLHTGYPMPHIEDFNPFNPSQAQ